VTEGRGGAAGRAAAPREFLQPEKDLLHGDLRI
jgi:hypothetical protein